jgi:hypothetical protein
MGRGRAKAKQTKVARELKYSSMGMDLDRLRQELVGKPEAEAALTDGQAADDSAELEEPEESDEPSDDELDIARRG